MFHSSYILLPSSRVISPEINSRIVPIVFVYLLNSSVRYFLADRQLLLNSSLPIHCYYRLVSRLWKLVVYKRQAGWRPIAVSFWLYIMCCTYDITCLSSVNCLHCLMLSSQVLAETQFVLVIIIYRFGLLDTKVAEATLLN